MRKIIIALVISLLWIFPAYAQEPDGPAEPDIPYDFQPVDYAAGEINPVATGLADMVTAAPFINRLGSIVITTWQMLDEYAGGGVLGYFALFIAGIWVIKFLSNFIFEKNVSNSTKEVEKDIDSGSRRRRRSKKYY